MEIVYGHCVALVVGFILDKALGDPTCLPHPIVVFGNMIALADKKLNHHPYRLWKGALSSLVMVVVVYLFFAGLIYGAYAIHLFVGCFVESIFVFYGIAATTLINEGKAVFGVLEKEGLEQGRRQLARIVGRDTSQIDEEHIKKATLETLAENLSDGVVAPLFWFIIGGVPAMMSYKMINTQDSMIGYKSDKYLYYGRFSAKLDDVVNYIPARITAFLMALFSFKKKAFRFIFWFGRAHTSPNAGYPEAALAGILDVQFGGTHVYFGKAVRKPVIGEKDRIILGSDLDKTVRNMQWVVVGMVLIGMAVLLSMHLPLSLW
ncbi:adenosylcobinamide-phosphate synthase CbiB [Saccharicrinis fermentans]|uniref:Cobalamin biosynthesis protein CobD n=1 Tax=Saccharicrinis fermentans DSM 9555 = JCM 21142 TaxID=869213 RepID=W7YCC2_9BACT|nr:adenosylcobinamide-phosphate synthase CbiB [Saccharicrinis fermentans]GAF02086.1 cobalamin biosynthesis protein [Saccharicrinis fermentans DSM 9555 = JCM 21142]